MRDLQWTVAGRLARPLRNDSITLRRPISSEFPRRRSPEQRLASEPIDRKNMLAKRVIPCLDVDRGRVVKGTKFLNLRDAGDPVEVASQYEAEGADELVFLDITASHEGRAIMLDVVRRTAEVVFMPLTVGGGIRSLDDIRALLNAGSDKVSINSAAVRDPEFVRRRPPGGLATNASS